jgi:hypothetical protein
VAESVPEERRSSNEPEPPERGFAVVLWLFAVLIAEVEALLWLFERMYGCPISSGSPWPAERV